MGSVFMKFTLTKLQSISKSSNISDYIKKEYRNKIKKITFKKNIYKGTIFIETQHTIPDWSAMINGLANTKLVLKNTSYNVLIILEIAKEHYGVSFNHGQKFLETNKIDLSFGKNSRAKLLSKEHIRQVNSTQISSVPIISQKLRSVYDYIPNGKEMDYSQLNVLSDIKGKTTINTKSIYINGTESLCIDSPINDSGNLLTLIDDMVAEINKTNNASQPFTTVLQPENSQNGKFNKSLTTKFGKLLKSYRRSTNNSISTQSSNGIHLIYAVKEDTNLIKFPGIINMPFSTENLDSIDTWNYLIRDLNKKMRKNSSLQVIDYLKKAKLEEVNSNNEKIKSTSLFKCISFYDKRNSLVLFQGKLYELPRDYVDKIIQKINNTKTITKKEFPSFSAMKSFHRKHITSTSTKLDKYTENSYNDDVQQQNKNSLIKFDKQNFSNGLSNKYPINRRSQIEICDLYEYQNYTKTQIFYCIKRYHNATSISHLVTQAQNAMETLTSFKAAQDFVSNITQHPINTNKKVVLGIIKDWKSTKISEQIPFLSLITIYNLIIKLKSLGIETIILKIKE